MCCTPRKTYEDGGRSPSGKHSSKEEGGCNSERRAAGTWLVRRAASLVLLYILLLFSIETFFIDASQFLPLRHQVLVSLFKGVSSA